MRRLVHRQACMVLGAVLGAVGCRGAPPPDLRKERAVMESIVAPEVACSAGPGPAGKVLLHYRVRNGGRDTVHLLDGHRMPYVFQADDGALIVLHGVNPPDPGKFYNVIEVPLTRPLAPGEVYEGEVALPPSEMHDHYGDRPPRGSLHGPIRVVCRVGWGRTPITVAEEAHESIKQLLAWQHLAEAAPLEVSLP